MSVGELLDRAIPSILNDIKIVKRTEELLETDGRGGRFIVAFNELPTFLISNIETINKRVLNSGGSLEIITPNPSGLNKQMIKPVGDVEVYESQKNIKNEFAVFYDNVILVRHTDSDDKFYLKRDSSYFKDKYTEAFDKMKEEPFVSLVN